MTIRKEHLRFLLPIGTALVMVAACGILELVSRSLIRGQIHQQAAERWASDGSYAMVSVFAAEDSGFDEASADALGEQVDAALKEASLKAEHEDVPLWYRAWSVPFGTVSVNGATRTTATAAVTAVGGSFFTMHPMTLVDGVYLTENDLMHDRIVIDTTLAWQLFGSPHVSGQEVRINDQTYLIAGVVRPEKTAAYKAAYSDRPCLYIDYALYRDWIVADGGTPRIACYEAVLPCPVRGFARKPFDEALSEQTGITVVQNTGRYSLMQRWKTLRGLRRMVMQDTGVAYPYWENAARLTAYDTAVLFGWQIALLVWPVIVLIVLFWKGYRRLERFLTARREARKRRYRTPLDELEQY
ncbi:MAG: ABC transporter permease [Oscillospiraceae bacterium]|nr:ABC transporter permease [Oscillospiraceae bacterium]